MVIRSPNGTTEVIDARETAPAAATETMFKGKWTTGYPMLTEATGLLLTLAKPPKLLQLLAYITASDTS